MILDIREKIFDLLEKSGISQKKFAEKLGIDAAIVAKWKSGQSNTYLRHLNRISSVLNTTEIPIPDHYEDVSDLSRYHKKPPVYKNDAVDRMFSLIDNQGIQQKELAKSIGLSANVFSSWRKRKSDSYLKHISNISKALGVSPEWLLNGTVSDNPVDPETLLSISKNAYSVALAFDAASERDKNIVMFILGVKYPFMN